MFQYYGTMILLEFQKIEANPAKKQNKACKRILCYQNISQVISEALEKTVSEHSPSPNDSI